MVFGAFGCGSAFGLPADAAGSGAGSVARGRSVLAALPDRGSRVDAGIVSVVGITGHGEPRGRRNRRGDRRNAVTGHMTRYRLHDPLRLPVLWVLHEDDFVSDASRDPC